MERYKKGNDRNQISLLPMCLDDMLSDDAEVRGLGGLKPDFKTIADFRKDNKQPIKAAFQKFSIICCELGLIGKEIVAVDGSKFRASNSRLKYHSEKKIEEKIKHHAEKAEMYMALLDACDQDEDVQPTLTREEIIGKINKVNTRLVELSTLREEVSKSGTIYETDRDSRMMKTNSRGRQSPSSGSLRCHQPAS